MWSSLSLLTERFSLSAFRPHDRTVRWASGWVGPCSGQWVVSLPSLACTCSCETLQGCFLFASGWGREWLPISCAQEGGDDPTCWVPRCLLLGMQGEQKTYYFLIIFSLDPVRFGDFYCFCSISYIILSSTHTIQKQPSEGGRTHRGSEWCNRWFQQSEKRCRNKFPLIWTMP